MSIGEGASPGEVKAFETGLRRSGARRVQEPGDPGLSALLQHIDQRRRQRAGGAPGIARRPAGEPAARPTPLAGGTPGTVLSVERVGAEVRILRVVRPAGFAFKAGQYTKVSHGSGPRRSFSLASAPHEAHLELCVALNPGGKLTPALFGLAAGARIDVDDRPRGRFGLDAGARRHLMVATSTGIAPFRSMVLDALHRGTDDRFVIVHGARHASGLPYRDELSALAASDQRVEYLPSVTQPEGAWTGRTGRVDGLALDAAGRLDAADTHAYACGNPDMVASVAASLVRAGFGVSGEKFD
jgi:ferredoxin-NADP reductase